MYKMKVEANNQYMNEAYNPSKTSSYISNLDANNPYGFAMSKNTTLHTIISNGTTVVLAKGKF